MKTILSLLAAGAVMSALSSPAQVAFSGNYSQNFDTLATTGTTIAWSQSSTLSGWSLFAYTNNTSINDYNAGDGSSTAGHFYSFGTTGSSDRALGGLASGNTYFGSPAPASGAIAGYIALALQNTSGGVYDNFTLSYAGEQWRDGGNATPVAQTMVLEYGFGATFDTVSLWTAPGGTFNFSSPVFATSGAAVNGNTVGRVNGLGGTITGLTWNPGDTLWIRWIERNDTGNDHGLAIDDLSVTVPEPTVMCLSILGGLGVLFGIRRRR